LKISELGLVEMYPQTHARSIARVLSERVPNAKARGNVKSRNEMLRQIFRVEQAGKPRRTGKTLYLHMQSGIRRSALTKRIGPDWN
jgi:Ribonuclease G/E